MLTATVVCFSFSESSDPLSIFLQTQSPRLSNQNGIKAVFLINSSPLTGFGLLHFTAILHPLISFVAMAKGVALWIWTAVCMSLSHFRALAVQDFLFDIITFSMFHQHLYFSHVSRLN